jgi:hypothetical protein
LGLTRGFQFGFLREVEKVKPNKANSFDKIMVAIAIFALVGFCAALWKIVG